MLVYDSTSTSNTTSAFECTYTTFQSNHSTATPEHPILVLDNSSHPWEQDSAGILQIHIKRPPLNSSLMTEWNSAIFYRLTPVLQA